MLLVHCNILFSRVCMSYKNKNYNFSDNIKVHINIPYYKSYIINRIFSILRIIEYKIVFPC